MRAELLAPLDVTCHNIVVGRNITRSELAWIPRFASGSVPENSDDERRLLRERLGLLNRVTFFVSVAFLVLVGVTDWASQVAHHTPAGRISHACASLVALVTWLGLRRERGFSSRTLVTIDVVTTVAIGVGFVAMSVGSVQPFGLYTALLAITHINITRAVLVPTTPRRTLRVALGSFAGFVLVPVISVLADPASLPVVAPSAIEGLSWTTAGIAVSTVASRVTYGLQARAKQAIQLGQYTLEEKIAEGGMGAIYRASHAMLRRPTAIKLMIGGGSDTALRHFENEVQLTARLTHPNTISIYDYGRTRDGIFYYAMELLEGLTLEELVQRHGRLPPERAIHVLLQVCGALGEAHGIGLIHRDIKPANVFLCRRGGIDDFVKVLDFGLVRELRAPDGTHGMDHTIAGTPLYMSPEAIEKPAEVDARSDIYALGVVAYFLVTGTTPFTADSLAGILARQLYEPPPQPSLHAALPRDLEAVILHCLQKNRDARPASIEALARELEACADAYGWSHDAARTWWNAHTSMPREPTEALAHGTTLRATAPRWSAIASRTVLAVDLHART